MSEQAPGRPEEDGRNPPRRPAPSGYGAPSSEHQGATQAGGRRPSASAGSTDGAGNPVYGRVTRFGTPGGPAVPSRPVGSWPPPGASYASPGPPAPWPANDAAPPAGAYPYPAPPGLGHHAAPPAWAAPPPPWGGPAPRPHRHRDEYASWGRRVAGFLVDEAPGYVASTLILISYLPLYVGLFRRDVTAQPTWPLFAVGMLLSLASTGWTIYNRWFVAGRTGQSVGKRVTRTWLVSTLDGRPVGLLNAFLRDLLHVVDGLGCVGYLWPLWDEQRQTLADKIIQTVVVRTPVAPLSDAERASRG